ncbi:MAG TPA: hypothetical protein VGD10_02860 [Allosphingosinicella sp.]|uniref:hypothetical protein n=1 Tax=Allosphingosinicella sp. TaxID=2823234 RepID=UPI002EDBB438
MRALIITAALLLSAGCSERGLQPTNGNGGMSDPDRPVSSPPISQPVSPPPPMQPGGNQCGAASLQWLVGKQRSAIPAISGRTVRIACTTCPVTEDYSPQRLNIFYDERTNVIKEVNCG